MYTYEIHCPNFYLKIHLPIDIQEWNQEIDVYFGDELTMTTTYKIKDTKINDVLICPLVTEVLEKHRDQMTKDAFDRL